MVVVLSDRSSVDSFEDGGGDKFKEEFSYQLKASKLVEEWKGEVARWHRTRMLCRSF